MMRGGGKRAFRVAALLAFAALLFQALLFQPHVHAISLVSARAQPTRIATFAPAIAADECALCRELAQSGTFVAATPPLLKTASPSVLPASIILPLSAVRDMRPRIWNSRGPPSSIAA
jgi:hypothetical protein